MKNVSARPKKKVQTNEEVVWLYEYILQYITSPVFRDPIKDFIDQNCILFESTESENSFDQTEIHNQFKKLIEDLLDMMLIDVGASYEQFVEAARYGLQSDGKKYFEQIIACDSYIYFKSLMVKRNLHLQSEAYELMYANATKQKESAKKMVTQDPDYLKLQKEKEENEIQAALRMSLALEEEKKKLEQLEDEEFRRALEMSSIKEIKETPKKLNPLIPKGKKQGENKPSVTDEFFEMARANAEKNKNIVNELESNNQDMAQVYEKIQKDKEEKLKEYRNMVMKLKKDRRDNDLLAVEEEEKPKKEAPLDERIEKKRLEMRKMLAEKLNKANK